MHTRLRAGPREQVLNLRSGGYLIAAQQILVEIGGVPIRLTTTDPVFRELLENRYAGFVSPNSGHAAVIEVDIASPGSLSGPDDVQVALEDGLWVIQRGDFYATWDPATRRGKPLLLAGQGGFLLHAASGVRNGRAFLFSGLSGAGKTTLSRLAPPPRNRDGAPAPVPRRAGSSPRGS
jgi:hypothetical protein